MDNKCNKVVYDLDLNSPPADSQEENLTSWEEVASTATSSAANSHPLPNMGSYCTPITVDSDEPTGFPQMRNPSTRSIMTIVLDEDVEINPRQSDNGIEDPSTTLTLFTHNKYESIPRNTTKINCDHLQDTDAGRTPKRRNVTGPTQDPAEVVSKEPNDDLAKVVPEKSTITCPICWNPPVEASSTICGHVFCHCCIKEAITVYKSCPTCRKKLTRTDVHPIFLLRCPMV